MVSAGAVRIKTFWDYLRFEFQPGPCWVCQRGFGRAVCATCVDLLPALKTAACRTCARPLTGDLSLCGECFLNPSSVDAMIVAQHYRWPWPLWIPDLKFKQGLARGHFLAQCILNTINHTPDLLIPEVLIPVPLHSSRELKRGYNQAQIIAQPLSIWLDRPLRTDLVLRSKATLAQSDLKASARKCNLRGAFKAVKPIAYKSVGIIDDVITTRSTVEALAQVLKAVGVQQVIVFAGCRA